MTKDFIKTLEERGFIHQATDLEATRKLMLEEEVTAYIGFDLTAPSLHVGSMIQLMVLRHLKEHGHRPIVLFGDATTRVGDPSDKSGLRPILTEEQIEKNRIGIVQVVDRIVGNCQHVHNSVWLDDMKFMDFLQGPARNFTLNRMLNMDIVSRRLEANLPMTIMELCYSMMQGMDFAELFERKGVRLQIGGSDQWSNILAGIEIARREGQKQLFGITTPLMTDEQGRKMGKTAEGKAVWLSPELVSSFDLWQFWRSVPDGKVREFLGLFTDLPMDEVNRLGGLAGSEINEAKKVLATEAVAIAHGREAALQAEATSRDVFEAGTASADMPRHVLKKNPAITLTDVLVESSMVESKAAARRLAQQGGLKIGNNKIDNCDVSITDVLEDGAIVSCGKKKKMQFVFEA
jgi:tyrosyl-tRNA synthetase